MSQSESFTRRNLPHWFVPGAAHFITYRLFGTLPKLVLDELRSTREARLSEKPPNGCSVRDHRILIHKQLFAEFDNELDGEKSVSHLADSRIAEMVRSNLYHHDGKKYHLMSYCVMPNHMHVLLQPQLKPFKKHSEIDIGEQDDSHSPLSKIMHSLKSYTAHEANKILKRTGTFWQAESYDHWVRDENELERILAYITANPVKAGLVVKPEDWVYSSCYDRFVRDGDRSGWLGL